jgi:hypothetical protein
VFTRALHWSLSWDRSIESIPPHIISLRSVLILSSHLCLSSALLDFPPYSYMNSSSPHVCYMPFPSHHPWLDHSNKTWRRVQVMKLLMMQLSPFSRSVRSVRSRYVHSVLQHLCLQRLLVTVWIVFPLKTVMGWAVLSQQHPLFLSPSSSWDTRQAIPQHHCNHLTWIMLRSGKRDWR